VHRDFEEADMEMGFGVIRKALFIATFGLSGLVLKDNKKKQRTAQAARKAARPANAKAGAAKSQKARSRPKSARAGTAARSAKGTAGELERLAELHREGALTDAEFSAGKARILATPVASSAPAPQPRIARPYPAVEASVSAARQIDELAERDRPSVPSFNSD
jgi:hypothetical protein